MNEDLNQKLPLFGAKTIMASEMGVNAGRGEPEEYCVVHEDMLSIDIEGVGSFALMWTPTTKSPGAIGYTSEDGLLAGEAVPESLALATGFMFTEGLVNSLAEIAAMWVCADRPDVVNVRLLQAETVKVRRRNVVVNSSCGICGGREQLINGVSSASLPTDALRMRVSDFARIRGAMQRRQRIFGSTGGTHGAALFDADLNVVAVAEDLGRHNALDKLIGYRLLSGLPFGGCGAFISSRLSYEMVAKAVRAGLDVLAAISAPSSLAIEIARHHQLTLCGFVRGDTAMVYATPHRIMPEESGLVASEQVRVVCKALPE